MKQTEFQETSETLKKHKIEYFFEIFKEFKINLMKKLDTFMLM